MTGANRWTGLNTPAPAPSIQQSLGYIDNGYNTGLNANWSLICGWKTHRFHTPLNRPALHQLVRRVRYGYQPDPAADHRRQRFLRRDGDQRRREVDARHDVGRLPINILQQMPVGGSFAMTINACPDIGELRCQQRRAL